MVSNHCGIIARYSYIQHRNNAVLFCSTSRIIAAIPSGHNGIYSVLICSPTAPGHNVLADWW